MANRWVRETARSESPGSWNGGTGRLKPGLRTGNFLWFRRCEIVRVIGTAHHRAAGHMHETHPSSARAVFGERGRRNEFDHGQVLQRRLKILAEGEDVALDAAQVFQR